MMGALEEKKEWGIKKKDVSRPLTLVLKGTVPVIEQNLSPDGQRHVQTNAQR